METSGKCLFFHCEFCTWRVSRQGNYYLPPILSYLIHLCDVEMCMVEKKTCIHLMHEIRRDFAFQIHSASWLEIKKKQLTFLYCVLGPTLEKEMATHSSILPWKNPKDGGTWQATDHGISTSWTQLSTCQRSSRTYSH